LKRKIKMLGAVAVRSPETGEAHQSHPKGCAIHRLEAEATAGRRRPAWMGCVETVAHGKNRCATGVSPG